MAMVVRPLAAESSASCTTFSDAESSAEVAYREIVNKRVIRVLKIAAHLIQKEHCRVTEQGAGNSNTF
jgi:hypothetical protein